MITVDKKNIDALVRTLKGVMPANYESMDRLVACVSYLEALLEAPDTEPREGVKDG